jgi:hypothetical protein
MADLYKKGSVDTIDCGSDAIKNIGDSPRTALSGAHAEKRFRHKVCKNMHILRIGWMAAPHYAGAFPAAGPAMAFS